MKYFLAASVFALMSLGAWAQTVSNAALAECQADGKAFTAVKECLPETEVALQMLNVVTAPEFYGDSAVAIVAGCGDANKKSPARWACVNRAIGDAVDLLQMVGSADKISDPRFKGVSDSAILKKLKVKETAARKPFGQRMWGGTMFYSLK